MAALLLLAAPAFGQVPVFAESFDTPADLASWLNSEFATWSSLDFSGSPASGSAQITNDIEPAGSYPIWAFVPVTPGDVLTFRVHAWIPPAQMGSGEARLRVVWWDASNVVGGFCPWAKEEDIVGSDDAGSTAVTGGWRLLQATLTVPAGATCGQMRLTNYKSDVAPVPFVVHFDEAEVFLPEPTSHALAGAAIGVLVALRPRSRPSAFAAPGRTRGEIR